MTLYIKRKGTHDISRFYDDKNKTYDSKGCYTIIDDGDQSQVYIFNHQPQPKSNMYICTVYGW